MDISIEEAQKFPNNFQPKKPTLKHIIVKMSKVKTRRKLKAEKQLIENKGNAPSP